MTGHELPKVIEIELRIIMESSVLFLLNIFLIYYDTIYITPGELKH